MIENNIQKVDPSIVISIFRRYKVESEVVKPFLEFDESIREDLLRLTTLAVCEEPTLLSFTDINCWLLLTTERLIWQQSQKNQSISYSEIASVNADCGIPAQSFAYKAEGKDIALQTLSGQKITISTGVSGAVHLALLSALEWTLQKIKSSS